jgi:chaperonin GroEL
MFIRSAWERALPAVIDAIQAGARPLRGRHAIADLAVGMCQGDRALADMLGEIFDIIGAEGLTVVEGWNRLGLEREYVEGTYWKLSGWFSRLFINQPAEKRVVYEDAALLMTDFALKDPHQLVPVLERCVKAGVNRLMIVAADVSDSVVALLANNTNARVIESAVVRIPKVADTDRLAALEDLVALAGGRAFCSAAFGSLETFGLDDLGHARRAWATDSLFGVYGGAGDARKLRQRMQQVRAQLRSADDPHQKSELQARLGRLSGGTAILRLGAIHETERDARKRGAERAIAAVRQALDGGVVDGGGAALLRAQQSVCAGHARSDDERLALAMLARALEAPLRAIAQNAGHAPDVIVERVRAAPAGHGFDARCGGIVDLREAGIADAAATLERALRVAVSGAAMALTTDVIVHHRNPVESIEP